jgi:tetratricopeptide (TPR) repeat protein
MVMVNKKKKMPLPKRNLQACQDLYEKAMLEVEADRPEGFKRHMGQAILDGEKLLSQNKSGVKGEDSLDDINEFVAQCCYELGTYLLEEEGYGEGENAEDDDDLVEKCAARAKPHLERSVELYRGQNDVSQSFCRPAVIALSTAYAVLHEHDKDIDLCEEFVARLTKQYNQWTPLQNDLLLALAGAFNLVGKMDDAEKIYKQIVSICKTNFGDDGDQTAEAEQELLDFLNDREFGLCACKMTPEQLAALAV